MNLKLKHFLIIFSILLFAIQVQADAPISYNKELASDVKLRGTFFTNDNSDSFYVSFNDGIIKIDSDKHFTDKTIKIKGTALTSRLKKYNGFNVGITHISDKGIITNEIKPLIIDKQGFAYLTCDFSTVIINGMTGTTTTTLNGLSGNQSILVPNGSSYDLNITNNQEGVWTSSDGKNYQNKSIITINGSMVTTEIGIPLQLFTNLEGVNDTGDIGVAYTNLTAIPREIEYIWDSDNVSLYFPFNTTSGVDSQFVVLWGADNNTEPAADSTYGSQAVWDNNVAMVQHMKDNPDISHIKDSTSSGYDGTKYAANQPIEDDGLYGKFQAFDGHNDDIDCGDISEMNIASQLTISIRAKQDVLDVQDIIMGKYKDSDERIIIDTFTDGNMYIKFMNGATELGYFDYSPVVTAGKLFNLDVVFNGSLTGNSERLKVFVNKEQQTLTFVGTIKTTTANLAGYPLFLGAYTGVTALNGGIDEVRIDERALNVDYITTQHNNLNNPTTSGTYPFYLSIGATETPSGTRNITASVTGDNNTQSYNTSQSRGFTLTPTGTTNNVIINTTSTDYDVTVTTYWTENTTLQTETSTAGYAKQYINYTPSFNATSADLNTTFTFNFSAQDYIGTATSILNDVSKTTTRNGQDVNASVGSLIESTPYWWNVTVPYNNIFTLSNQSDITAFLGVSKQFSDSTYNDPEGLPIDSRLWNFGDGGDSLLSNPTHTYTTVGDFNANYSVTETATVSPQTIVREFNVSVSVQPVQNLTSTAGIDYIQFDWDNYSSADYWNISRLDVTIPFTSSHPVLDGIEDDCYDCCCAYGFVGDSPNPYTDYGKELIYILRNDTYLILYADGEDNDGFSQDDEFTIGIDASNNNLSTDDRKFILDEGGTVKAKQMTGSGSWIPIATNAQGVVVGAGVAGAIQYEMFIPVSELDTNFTNGSTVKFFMSRTHTASNPYIESYYPQTLQNDTDATLWPSVLLSETPQYTYINNTSISEYNVTGLNPYTWYQHQFTAINGSHESSSVDSSDITQQILLYSVSGYILDISGNPIAGAFVYAENGVVGEFDTSDVYGFYEGIRFKTQNYTITGNKSGYVDNFIIVNVTGNLTNQNITLTAFEMTDWMLWEKLLEIEDAIDDLSTDFTPTEGNYEMLSSTYNIFLLLLGACFILAFPKRGEVTERDTGLNNVLFSFLGTILAVFLAQIIVSGQVVESFAFESQIYDPLQHYFLYLIAVIMFVVFALNAVYYVRQRVD